MMDEATAGSIPTLFSINGMDAPVSPAIIKLPVIAKNNTKPSITGWIGIIKQGDTQIQPAH